MQQFVDEAVIEVRSGKGGPGSVSFRREKYVPRGGPDGGDGGDGGDVVVTVRENLKTLRHLRMKQHYRAGNGMPGSGRQRHGSRGEDAVVEVPPGTIVTDVESGEAVCDLAEEGQSAVICRGGRGGQGNVHFKSSTNQTPRYAQPGLPGEERRLRVELRLIADIGFVGLPSVGKSSLLKALTAAHPKVASYPFTTVIPNLGVIHYYDRDIVLADLPGLIEGAARGAGLGHRFLKHVQRTRALVYVLDATAERPEYDVEVLEKELGSYARELIERPRLLLLNKIDLLDPEGREELSARFGKSGSARAFQLVSAATREGLEELKGRLFQLATGEEEQHEGW
ncbi:MAG: GTPase ObgE [Spirochaetaceae bacterium]